MCSPRSPQRPEALAALGAAAVRVAEESFFAFAEPCDLARVAGLLRARPGAEPWLLAAVAFTGPFEGVVRVALPRALAGELGGAFCGVRPETLDDAQITDFAGELANMVCGLWLTQTHRTERFALAAPIVTPADDEAASAAAADPAALGVVLNEMPVLLTLVVNSPAAES